MLYPIYLIKDAQLRLSTMNANIEKLLKKPKSFDSNDFLPKIKNALRDARCGTSELLFGAEQTTIYYMLSSILSKTAATIEREGMEIDIELLHSELSEAVTILNTIDENTYDYAFKGYYKSNFLPYCIPGHYPVPRDIFSVLAEHIEPLERPMNILFVKDSDANLASGMRNYFSREKAMFYGIGLKEDIDSYARGFFDKAALGSSRGSSITNSAFDMLVLSPRANISLEMRNANIEKTLILEDVRNSVKYLRAGGYLFFGLPFSRLSQEVSAYLARTFDDIQVLKPNEGYSLKHPVAYIVARKKDRTLDSIISNNVADNPGFITMREASYIQDAATVISEMRKISLPEKPADIQSFSGAVMDMVEMLNIVKASPAAQQFFADQNAGIPRLSDRHPLLPFSKGQLGLTICSGCLDGVIEESNDCCHLVKGRVVKYSEVANTEEGLRTVVSTTESNRVEINILTPDGEHKILA